MNHKIAGAVVMVLVVSLMSLVPAWGGGWAVVTLDALPSNIHAEEAFPVGFTVRQHGRTPLGGLDTAVVATHSQTQARVSVPAKGQGAVGHYVAIMTLSEPGEWTWGIDAFGMVSPMPALVVESRSGSAAPAPTLPPATTVAASGLAALLGLTLVLRRRTAFAAGAIAASLVLAGAGGLASRAPTVEVAEAAPSTPIETGAALFVAKGCITCHMNQRVTLDGSIRLSMGPDLSLYRREPAFLRDWLANPAAVRPSTEMPDLELNPDEIEALIAFLNAE